MPGSPLVLPDAVGTAGEGRAGAFPEALFTISGDPASIDDAADRYGSYAAASAELTLDLRNNRVASWLGSEGDLYRSRVNEFVPMTTTAHSVFADINRLLTTFALTMASQQKTMRSLHDHARQVWEQLKAARATQGAARVSVGVATLATMTPDMSARQDAQKSLATATATAAAADAAVARLEGREDEALQMIDALEREHGHATTPYSYAADVDDFVRRFRATSPTV